MGKYDTAIGVLDSIKANEQSRSIAARVAKLRGDCSFSRGDFDDALTHYKGATRWLMNEDWVNDALDKMAIIKEYSFHNSETLLEVHAQVERLRKLGQYNEALTICLSAIEGQDKSDPTDRIQLEIADLLALQMKAMEAISVYKELVQSQSPLASEAQFRIAGIYWQQLNSPQQAIEEYSALIENYPESVLVADARKQIRRLASEQPSSSLP
jgi:tetratricopeptide (TPR) repeat protein